ncbi:MAG: hypothetical protein RIC15_08830 [Vicingaceae bacterium]
MTEIIKVFGLLIISGVKFFFAPSTAILSGYSYLETIIITTSGGVGGLITFYYFGEFLQYVFTRSKKKKKEKKKFTRLNRRIIKVKSTYGLIGLAILTPCLFSIPLGSLLAARYFDKDKRTLPFMIASVVLWSFVLTTFSLLFN